MTIIHTQWGLST